MICGEARQRKRQVCHYICRLVGFASRSRVYYADCCRLESGCHRHEQTTKGVRMMTLKRFASVSVVALIAMLSAALLPSGQMFAQTRTRPALGRRTAATPRLVPIGTDLKVRLNDHISSKTARVGDRFTATVVDPNRYDGATVTGHISSVRKSGRVKGSTRLGFAFDSITLSEGR